MRWLLALCLLVSGACEARPFTATDLVRLESYGQVITAPRHALLLVERRRAYDTADDYSFGPLTPRLLSRIMVAVLNRPTRLEPLFAQGAHAGYWMGSLSPNGHRLTVFRLRDRSLHLGVADLRTRRVRWLAVHPDLPLASPAPIWLDDHRLVVVTMPGGDLPPILTLESGLSRDLRRLWARASAGKGSSETSAASNAPSVPDAAARTLVTIDVDDGRATTLLTGNIVDAALSPDHTHLAVMTAGEHRRPGSGTIDTSFIARHHQLTIVNMRAGTRAAASSDILPGFLRWSPTSDRVLAFTPSVDLRAGHFVTVDRRADVITLAPGRTPLVTADQSAVMVHATWHGDAIIACMSVGGSARWIRIDRWASLPGLPDDAELVGSDGTRSWFQAENHLIALDEHMRIDSLARHVREIVPLLLDPSSIGYRALMNPPSRPGGWITADASGAMLVSGDGQPLGRIDAGSQVVAMTPGGAVTLDVDARGVGKLGVRTPGHVTVIDRNSLHLRDVALPAARRLDVGGQHHWLLLPSGVSRAALVVIPYPGQSYGLDLPASVNPATPAVPTNVQVLTSAGFAVLLPSLPTMPSGAPPRPLVEAVERAVGAATATGMIDARRVAILGHSFGAYAAMVLATHSDRFGAIIASSGPYDLATTHASMTGPDRTRLGRGLPFASSSGWTEGGQAKMLLPPLAPATRYVDASPMFAANRIVAPVLLVHGDLDTVGVDQAEHMFMELARHRADATLVRYWGEGHVLSSPANIRDYWARVIRFLRDHLVLSRPIPAPTPRS